MDASQQGLKNNSMGTSHYKIDSWYNWNLRIIYQKIDESKAENGNTIWIASYFINRFEIIFSLSNNFNFQ